jgi:hypothetical protein
MRRPRKFHKSQLPWAKKAFRAGEFGACPDIDAVKEPARAAHGRPRVVGGWQAKSYF